MATNNEPIQEVQPRYWRPINLEELIKRQFVKVPAGILSEETQKKSPPKSNSDSIRIKKRIETEIPSSTVGIPPERILQSKTVLRMAEDGIYVSKAGIRINRLLKLKKS